MAGIYGEAGHHALVINAHAAPAISLGLAWLESVRLGGASRPRGY
jgi:hypothetical protein